MDSPISDRDRLHLKRLVETYGAKNIHDHIDGMPKRARGRPKSRVASLALQMLTMTVDEMELEHRRRGTRAPHKAAIQDFVDAAKADGQVITWASAARQYSRGKALLSKSGVASGTATASLGKLKKT